MQSALDMALPSALTLLSVDKGGSDLAFLEVEAPTAKGLPSLGPSNQMI